MPQDNNTLQAQLLRRATSIGPSTSETPLPKNLGMENQQPDPFLAVMDVMGDPLGNSMPGAAGGPVIAEGKAVETLLDMLRGGLKQSPVGRIAEEMPEITKATGRRVPETIFMKSPSPKLEYPHEMPMKRSPDIYERLAQQRQASARDSVTASGKKRVAQDSGGYAQNRIRTARLADARTKVNTDVVKAIRAAFDSGRTVTDIAAEYPHLSPATVRDITSRSSWSWVK